MMENCDWKASLSGKIALKVTPRASSERIVAENQPDGSLLLKVYVTCVAEDGKANAAVIALLAKTLGLAKSAITIVRGDTSRNKVVEIRR